MTTNNETGIILVAPHRFPNVDRERALAERMGREIVVADDQASWLKPKSSWSRLMPR